MSLKSDCLLLIKNAIEAINPQKLVKNSLKVVNGDTLLVNNKFEYKLNKNVYVAAFGKAVNTMCVEVENILKDHLVKGVAALPVGSTCAHLSKIRVFYGAHNNIPDKEAFEAAKEIYKMCESLQQNDLLIACVTGGGSALLPLPVDEISLEDKIKTIKLVSSAGANINELNVIRGSLSKVKCGGLARCAYPANVISLIISDVIGDPLDIIASGPTYVTDLNEKYKISLDIVKKYDLDQKLPEAILEYLNERSKITAEINMGKNVEDKVKNFLIGNNKLALEAIREHAIELNYNPCLILTNSLDGEAKDVAKYFVCLAFIFNNYNFYQKNKQNNLFQKIFNTQSQFETFEKFLIKCLEQLVVDEKLVSNKICILTGGETTVKLAGSTKDSLGGRNQEMALSFKKELIDLYKSHSHLSIGNFLFTSFGTDGIDGPTDAAGAIVSNLNLIDENEIALINKCLKEHDSYHYFKNDLIKIVHTGTNVSDIQILLINN